MSAPAKAAADQAQRRAALDPTRSFIVQAPAGSGKTELLIQRILTLLGRVEQPERILAITFTRKASGEMRSRVIEALEKSATGAQPKDENEAFTLSLAAVVLQQDTRQSWNLRMNPSRLRIQTIDSLCASIVKRMPWMTRLGAMPEPEENATVLYDEAARQMLSVPHPAVDQLALHLDNNFPRMQEMFRALLAKRDQWLRHIGTAEASSSLRAALESMLQSIIDESLAQAAASCPDRPETILALLKSGAAKLEGLEVWREVVETLLTQKDEWRKALVKKSAFTPDEAFREALVRVRQLPDPVFADKQWSILAALLTLLPIAAAELKLLFAAQGKVDFVEIAEAARRALGEVQNPTDLALYLGERFEHILVDEVQDTSVTQAELLEKLIAAWDQSEERTLFLVGDPMQSIYKFREAEVGLFLRMRTEGVAGLGLTPLRLTTNFRSRPAIVDWVNLAFAQAFPAVENIPLGAVTYSPSVAHRDAADRSFVQVHPLFESDEEARLVAELVQQASEGSTAILVRARSHAAAIAGELRARGIGFRAVDMDPLAERPVIEDLTALARALLHPADRTAWLAVLRAPWCGLTLGELLSFRSLDDSEPTFINSDLDRIRPILIRAVEATRRKPLWEVLERTWRELGGADCHPGVSATADASRFFELVGDLGEEFEQGLPSLYAEPENEAAVQIMTIHKAKGLQFDTVILPGLGRRPRNDDPPLLRWAEMEDGLIFAPVHGSDEESDPIFDYLKFLDRSRSDNETARLLYVAATRAKDRLHLIGETGYDVETGMKKPVSSSLLALLWPSVEAQFQEAYAQHREAAGIPAESEPRRHLLRRVPAGYQPALEDGVNWNPDEEEVEKEPMTFQWVGDTLRHVGTVVHAFLDRIGREGPAHWTAAKIAGSAPLMRAALESYGVAPGELENAVSRVVRALQQTLADPRGRWALEGGSDNQNEFAAAVEYDGVVHNCVVDRTFIDENGVRWIVDYKTSDIQGSDREGFLDEELRRYGRQLGRYVRLFQALENRPVRAGLYFPLLTEWRELEQAQSA